jgi:hypothetical protein
MRPGTNRSSTQAAYQLGEEVHACCRGHVRHQVPVAPDVRPQVLDQVAVGEPQPLHVAGVVAHAALGLVGHEVPGADEEVEVAVLLIPAWGISKRLTTIIHRDGGQQLRTRPDCPCWSP